MAAALANQAVTTSKSLVDTDMLEQRAIDYFTQALSRATKLDGSRIHPDTLMEEVGLDSIMVIKMTAELEESFGVLSKTIFFENRTIRQVVDYFMEAHRDRLEYLLMHTTQSSVTSADTASPIATISQTNPMHQEVSAGTGTTPSPAMPHENRQAMDVAIIGLAGRYPQASTLEEFWRNLSEGRDSITVIPADRWDHARYFDSNPGTPNKTYGNVGGFLDKVTQFDSLFSISPRAMRKPWIRRKDYSWNVPITPCRMQDTHVKC